MSGWHVCLKLDPTSYVNSGILMSPVSRRRLWLFRRCFGDDADMNVRCHSIDHPWSRNIWYVSRTALLCTSPRARLHVVGVLRFMSDMNQPSLPTPLYSVLVSISAFMALSTVFHSINSPDISPFSHSVLPVLSLRDWSFQLYVSLSKSPSALL